MIEECCAPKGVVQQELLMAKFDEFKPEQEDDSQLYLNPNDETVAMLSNLEVEKTDAENHRHTVQHRTKDYEFERRTHSRSSDITRAKIQTPLLQWYQDMSNHKRGGLHHVLFDRSRVEKRVAGESRDEATEAVKILSTAHRLTAWWTRVK